MWLTDTNTDQSRPALLAKDTQRAAETKHEALKLARLLSCNQHTATSMRWDLEYRNPTSCCYVKMSLIGVQEAGLESVFSISRAFSLWSVICFWWLTALSLKMWHLRLESLFHDCPVLLSCFVMCMCGSCPCTFSQSPTVSIVWAHVCRWWDTFMRHIFIICGNLFTYSFSLHWSRFCTCL